MFKAYIFKLMLIIIILNMYVCWLDAAESMYTAASKLNALLCV